MDTGPIAGLAGLGLFLYGILLLEQGLKALAGRSFKTLLRRHTDHPVKAVAIGTLATAVLQSSSVVGLILLALVGAGIIGLPNALGIVLGANLGTTMTGWIVAIVGFKLDIDAAVLPVVAAGALLIVFTDGRYGRLASWGRLLLGFGLLLFGLNLLKGAMAGVAEQVDLVQFARFGAVPFAAAGFVFTAIVQSSSATMVITLAALHSGVIELQSAAALVIGADLGTTTTVLLGGFRGTAIKKQVALGHFLFNLITDVIALLALPLLLNVVVAAVGTDPLIGVVAFHSAFNLLGIALFLPFLGRFARFLRGWYQRDDVPLAGFEGLGEVDPSFPPVALDVLATSSTRFLRASCDLNRQALGLSGESGLWSQIVGEPDFLGRYAALKEVEGRLLAVAARVQREPLDTDQARRLVRIQKSTSNAGQAVKELRDVERNLRALGASPSEADQERLRTQQERHAKTHDALLALLTDDEPVPQADPESPVLTVLTELLDANRAGYVDDIERAFATTKTTGTALTDRINVSREAYSSTKRLIIAFAETLLDGEALRQFGALPNR